jgi:hypothetical protein
MDMLTFARENYPHMPVVGVEKGPVVATKTSGVRRRTIWYLYHPPKGAKSEKPYILRSEP